MMPVPDKVKIEKLKIAVHEFSTSYEAILTENIRLAKALTRMRTALEFIAGGIEFPVEEACTALYKDTDDEF
jgi:hypothetical protein